MAVKARARREPRPTIEDRVFLLVGQVRVLKGVVLELRRDVNRLKAKNREVRDGG